MGSPFSSEKGHRECTKPDRILAFPSLGTKFVSKFNRVVDRALSTLRTFSASSRSAAPPMKMTTKEPACQVLVFVRLSIRLPHIFVFTTCVLARVFSGPWSFSPVSYNSGFSGLCCPLYQSVIKLHSRNAHVALRLVTLLFFQSITAAELLRASEHQHIGFKSSFPLIINY